MSELKKEFYLRVDKTTGNWTYTLRLRSYPEQVGSQIATFNPHACLQRPNLMDGIVKVLNQELDKDDELRIL
jgi:hypothetical protein